MTAVINKLKDKTGNQQLPVTHERAVRDSEGTTLETKLQNLEGAMDKAYVAQSDNGMGRITLKKNMVSGVNTLTQSMMRATNTIYIIRYDFTLGEDITIPANCVLEFDGGSISAGSGENMDTITGQNTSIKTDSNSILLGITFGGTWCVEFLAEWLLPAYSKSRDYISDFTHLFNCGISSVTFTEIRTYKISDTIVIENDIEIKSSNDIRKWGGSHDQIVIKCESNKTVIEYCHTNASKTINIGGLCLRSGDENNPDYITPILLVRYLVTGWPGTHINFDISCNNNYAVYNGVRYNRFTMTGIELIAETASASFININGRISTYKGFYIHRNNENFITDTHINCVTECCYGGTFYGGLPVFLEGSHQTVTMPNTNEIYTSKYYFNSNPNRTVAQPTFIASNCYVWDLNTQIKDENNNVAIRCAELAYDDVYLANQESENKFLPANYPTKSSAMFHNKDGLLFQSLSDVTTFDIDCSQDNFNTILFTNTDILNKEGVLHSFYYKSVGNIGYEEINKFAAFINPDSIASSAINQSKPLQVRYKIRFVNSTVVDFYARLYSNTESANIKIIYNEYTSSDYSVLSYTSEYDTNMSNGNSVTNRNTFSYIIGKNPSSYKEIIVTYEISSSPKAYFAGKGYIPLFAFNIFDFLSSNKKYINTKYIQTDWIINSFASGNVYIPTGTDCIQGFEIVVPKVRNKDIIINTLCRGTINELVSDVTVSIDKDDNIKVLNGFTNTEIYKRDYDFSTWCVYRIKFNSCYVHIKQVSCNYMYIEGFLNNGYTTHTGEERITSSLSEFRKIGTTTQRPTPSNTASGYQYFDTTLSKPIYWNGTAWADATGTPV